MPIKDQTAILAAAPEYLMDQIVAVLTGTYVAPAGTVDGFGNVTANNSTSALILPPSNDTYLFKGLWSIDGTAWQEFGNSIIVGSQTNGLRQLTVTASSSLDLTTTPNQAGFFISAQNIDTNVYNVQYKIAVIARPDQTGVPVSTMPQALAYNSKNNYMKVLTTKSITLSNSSTTVVAHNLGYIPNIAAWTLSHWDDGSGTAGSAFFEMDEAGSSTLINSTNLILPKVTNSASLKSAVAYYTIYLDQ